VKQVGVVSLEEALKASTRATLDLGANCCIQHPIVVKIMDYGKLYFELKKAKAAQRKNAKQIQVKEMKFRQGTEEGDYQCKNSAT